MLHLQDSLLAFLSHQVNFLDRSNDNLYLLKLSKHALRDLQVAGKLQPFLMEIVQQYILKQETSTMADIDTVEQYIIDFQFQQQLVKPESRNS